MFKDIIGQDNALKALKNILSQKRTRGSYLFLGPDGTGKRSVAIEFAKSINCEKNTDIEPCDNCVSCKKIGTFNHPDFFNIAPEGASGSIKIDKIRDIIYQASLKPYESRKRIFVVNDAERMTAEAQNALLKVLEEPPANHILILTSSNISGMLPTVISRCRIIKFYCIEKNRIKEYLVEHGTAEKDALFFSRMSMGSMARAVDLRDRDVISERDSVINDFFVSKEVLFYEDVLGEYAGGNAEELIGILLSWYRDLLLSKFTDDREVLLNIDRSEELFSYASSFTGEKLEKDINTITETLGYIRANMNPKTALFNMALELKRG